MRDKRLRYGPAELLLVQPGATAYRPAPDPDAPGVQLALALAAQPQSGDHTQALLEQGGSPWAAAYVYGLARRPDKLTAPPPWPQELALLLGELLADALVSGPLTWRAALRQGPPFAAVAFVLHRARERAERRQARRLGVTPLTAPHPTLALPWLFGLALAIHGLARLARVQPGRPPWSLSGGSLAIRQLNKRRSWQRAYAAAAMSAQARSSASSSTSAGWAPETP